MPRRRKTPTERTAEDQRRIEDWFESFCPNVLGNPFMPQTPLPKQAIGLGMHAAHPTDGVFEMLYGGAAGPGKSSWLLMAQAQYAWKHGDYAGLIVRRTFAELSKPGAIMDRAIEWWKPRGVHWDGQNKTFTFPSGAKVAFGYLAHEHDHLQYQGAEFQGVGFDELTQWANPRQYEYIGLSRVRRARSSNVPLRCLSTSNPGGPGHEWVRDRFIGDPEAGIKARCPYLPGRLKDNPYIDQAAYIEGLMHLHPTVRQQLLDGDWRARMPGDYFRRDWFGPLLTEADRLPDIDTVRVRWWDLAASESADAARTASVLMAKHRNGVRVIEHATAARLTPGSRDDRIVQQAQADGHAVTVGLEIEPGSGGIAQFETLAKRLRSLGYRCVGARPRVEGPDLTDREKAYLSRPTIQPTGKAGRADPVASCLERGYQRRGECPDTGATWWGLDANRCLTDQRDGLRLVAGPWTQMYLDEVEGFPDAATCDLVDATSGAWAWLETKAFAHPTGGAGSHPRTSVDIHPDLRSEPKAAGSARHRPI